MTNGIASCVRRAGDLRTPEQRIESAVGVWEQRGALRYRKPIELGSNPGVEFEMADDVKVIRTRIYAAKHGARALVVSWPPYAKPSDADLDEFFDSFALTENGSARELPVAVTFGIPERLTGDGGIAMRDFGPEIERRQHLRQRPNAACEVFIGSQGHAATIVDASPGGVFIQTDAPVWSAVLVRVCFRGAERFALVIHQRHVPPRLRNLVPGGVGLRWVRGGPAD